MTLIRKRLITGPDPAVTLEDMRPQLRIDHTEEDALVTSLIASATAFVERQADRAFGSQTWEAVLDAFPTGDLDLPLGPVASVTSISYLDAANLPATVTTDVYALVTGSDPGTIRLLTDWPATYDGTEIVVRYVAGLGWPEDVKQAVRLLVAHWYANREAVVVGDSVSPLPMAVDALLGTHRRMFA
jgi:uncharacterized phiE125 gp8 family phage protein